ncbi:hypothetical protein P7K49_032562 [Saguinus oedipus]|uniref:Uncharacterized protein n=1 Tax=Saguinus oedipus TaxID=9490 RepID=A0ABQ9TYM1_SAGOE|nr:hypothetical protein P7K49_032562 [Saguinus oedipus]
MSGYLVPSALSLPVHGLCFFVPQPGVKGHAGETANNPSTLCSLTNHMTSLRRVDGEVLKITVRKVREPGFQGTVALASTKSHDTVKTDRGPGRSEHELLRQGSQAAFETPRQESRSASDTSGEKNKSEASQKNAKSDEQSSRDKWLCAEPSVGKWALNPDVQRGSSEWELEGVQK